MFISPPQRKTFFKEKMNSFLTHEVEKLKISIYDEILEHIKIIIDQRDI